MAPVPETEQSKFLGYGALVGGLIAIHLAVLFFWFYQLAKGTPAQSDSKKEQ